MRSATARQYCRRLREAVTSKLGSLAYRAVDERRSAFPLRSALHRPDPRQLQLAPQELGHFYKLRHL